MSKSFRSILCSLVLGLTLVLGLAAWAPPPVVPTDAGGPPPTTLVADVADVVDGVAPADTTLQIPTILNACPGSLLSRILPGQSALIPLPNRASTCSCDKALPISGATCVSCSMTGGTCMCQYKFGLRS